MDQTVSFAAIMADRVAVLQAVMNNVLAAEQNVMLPIIKALLVLFIARQFLLVQTGNMSMARFFDSIIRAAVIVFLVHGTQNYAQYVATKVFTNLPQALTAIAVGSYAQTNGAQTPGAQFDQSSFAFDSVVADVVKQTSWSSPASWINSIGVAVIDEPLFQGILWCIFGISLLGLSLLAIGLCIGPPFLLFELFERTRNLVDQWVAKIIGATAAGFATAITLAIQMQGIQTELTKIHGVAGTNAAEAAAGIAHLIGLSILDLFLMAACPVAFGFGSGIAVAMGAPAALAASRTMFIGQKMAGAVGRGAGATASAGARGAGKAVGAGMRAVGP